MYVRKFESDTLEDALSSIKKEMGPDAIILKTVTNKGIKGAFKKKKIEITAAISETNYTKKKRVDHVLDEDQKDKFYQNNSSYIAKKISEHSDNVDEENDRFSVTDGYGNMSLNKSVQSANNPTHNTQIKSKLDDFLSSPTHITEVEPEVVVAEENVAPRIQIEELAPPVREQAPLRNDQTERIDELERRIFELTQYIEHSDINSAPGGSFDFSNNLRSLGIDEKYIQNLIKKFSFEHPREELEDFDKILDYGLSLMQNDFSTSLPLFANTDIDDKAITIFISNSSSGQSSIVKKLAALNKDSVLLTIDRKGEKETNISKNFYDYESIHVTSVPQLMGSIKKARENKKMVFVDFENISEEKNMTKDFISGVKRAFDNVEVLVGLSAIHTEMYNRKQVEMYKEFSNGLVLSHLDLCLNFGAVFNLSISYPKLPFKFFGTGEVVPDDIESATSERILSELFDIRG
jgi:flagellar biosynthesis protein FlhF